MKYVDSFMVKKFAEGTRPLANGEFGYNRIEKFFYYQQSMVLPTGDGFAYKFTDFDVVSYWLPYFGDLQETNEIDVVKYVEYIMEHIKPALREQYKKDLKQYWANPVHNRGPRNRNRAEKINAFLEKESESNEVVSE